ncbi:hypothetical protein [Actinacidiphila sp. bgisy144]|uniref:hypothetical protein n=1 Tax=Actinacidiphila sp. bgisy144 TaxID=3413791 RepID=UPI003EB93627
MFFSFFGWLVLQVASAARIDLANGAITIYYPFVVRHVDVADVSAVVVVGEVDILLTTKDGRRLRQRIFPGVRSLRARKMILDFVVAELTTSHSPARRWQPRSLWLFLAAAIVLQLTAAVLAR